MTAPASAAAALRALVAMELRLSARRGEGLLVTLVIPAAVLVFFAGSGLLPAGIGGAGGPVHWLLPGAIALAVIASGLVSLGIATGYERANGVLKLLGAAPVSPGVVVLAKLAAVLVVELAQLALLVAVAWLVLDWRPPSGLAPGLVVAGLLLGTLAFAGLGLLIAGTLRAEATLAVSNGLFLGFLMLGGILLPVAHLAAPLDALARILPAAALSEVVRVGFGEPGDPSGALALLAVWGGGAAALAARTFRVE